mmetsp:Transcript_70032/g.216512  ORF Transcript_70032/g.216512 Transcript_70032/m.216512 type:complete len:120 (-) Transcript_70032:35-394(-)
MALRMGLITIAALVGVASGIVKQDLKPALVLHGAAKQALARPDGPMLMNRTSMDISDLPVGSRPTNVTTADWLKEYPNVTVLAANATEDSGAQSRASAPARATLWVTAVLAGCAAALAA